MLNILELFKIYIFILFLSNICSTLQTLCNASDFIPSRLLLTRQMFVLRPLTTSCWPGAKSKALEILDRQVGSGGAAWALHKECQVLVRCPTRRDVRRMLNWLPRGTRRGCSKRGVGPSRCPVLGEFSELNLCHAPHTHTYTLTGKCKCRSTLSHS